MRELRRLLHSAGVGEDRPEHDRDRDAAERDRLRGIDADTVELVPPPIDVDRLLLLVTGAHLRAESGDRPIAYRLRETILDWADRAAPGEPAFDVLVCSDVWWINNEDLQRQPTISVGGPGVNALTAQLGEAVQAAFVIENDLIVQVDLDFADTRAVLWGMDHAATVRAADAFVDRYLDAYLSAMLERLGGG